MSEPEYIKILSAHYYNLLRSRDQYEQDKDAGRRDGAALYAAHQQLATLKKAFFTLSEEATRLGEENEQLRSQIAAQSIGDLVSLEHHEAVLRERDEAQARALRAEDALEASGTQRMSDEEAAEAYRKGWEAGFNANGLSAAEAALLRKKYSRKGHSEFGNVRTPSSEALDD